MTAKISISWQKTFPLRKLKISSQWEHQPAAEFCIIAEQEPQ